MTTAADWVTKLILANLNQDNFSEWSIFLPAIKKERVLSREAVKAIRTKICPTWPIHRCSPSNCIIFLWFYSRVQLLEWTLKNISTNYFVVTISFSSCFLSSLYLLGHFNNMSVHSKISPCIFPFKTILSLCSSSGGLVLR